MLGSADLHIHTSASDGVATIAEVLNHVQRNTLLDVIAITDHDRVDAACWAYDHRQRYSFEIIPGVEVTTISGHVLGLWVTQPIPRDMSFEETVAAIHEQGGLAVLAHPYHFYIDQIRRYCMGYTRHPERLVEIGFDAIEVHNAGILFPGLNVMARRLANRAGLPHLGNSDAHTLGAVGTGTTRFQGKTAESLREAIINNQTVVEGRAWHATDYWNYLRNSTPNKSSEFLVEKFS